MTEDQEELERCLSDINDLIHSVRELAKEMNVSANMLRDSSGAYTLTPLLVAKAQLLSTLVPMRREVEIRTKMEEAKQAWRTAWGLPEEP